MMIEEIKEKFCLCLRELLFKFHLNDSFEDLHKWLKTLPQYNKLKEKAKNAVKQLLDENIIDGKDKYETSIVGFAKLRLNTMKKTAISNDISSDDNFRKFIAYLVVVQEGKDYTSSSCANCDLFELEFTSGDENQWSPEHLNESKFYSISNVVLNTLHFQSATNKGSSNISDEYKNLINAGGEAINDVPDKVEDYVVGTVYRKLIGDLPKGISFDENQNKYVFNYTKNDGTKTKKSRGTKRNKVKARELILEDFKEIRPDDWNDYYQKIQQGWEYDFYLCRDNIKQLRFIYRSKYDPLYMTTNSRHLKIHELSYVLADTQKGTAQWSIKKFKQFQDETFCEQEDSEERKEQIDNFIIELNKFIGEFKKDNEFPSVKKTPIVYKICELVESCILHTKNRNERIMRNNENKKQHKITSKRELFTIITNEIKREGLRCFYSKVKMSFSEMRFDFALSPERLNEKLGYIEGNVKLICSEFNTGLRQWSRELFKKTFRC